MYWRFLRDYVGRVLFEITPADSPHPLPLSVIIDGYFRGWMFCGLGYCDGHETAGTGCFFFCRFVTPCTAVVIQILVT